MPGGAEAQALQALVDRSGGAFGIRCVGPWIHLEHDDLPPLSLVPKPGDERREDRSRCRRLAIPDRPVRDVANRAAKSG
jgi:hypothetical protein